MRKLYLNVSLQIIVEADEGISTDDILDNIDIIATTDMEEATIVGNELISYEIVDSK